MTAKAVTRTSSARRKAQPESAVPQHCQPGRSWPLGASLEAGGVNFAVYSSVAEKVELCLFDGTGTREIRRLVLFLSRRRAPVTACASTGATTRRRGCAAIPTSCCSTPMRGRSTARCAVLLGNTPTGWAVPSVT